jgi:hypothetical protein
VAQHQPMCIVSAWQSTTKGQYWIETMHEYFGDEIKNTVLINIFGSAMFKGVKYNSDGYKPIDKL